MARVRLNRDFWLLWGSSTAGGLATRISLLAFPTIAVLVLHAGALAVGALTALTTLPVLLLSMFSGVVADRGNRRRIIIACDAASMLVIGTVPLAAALGHLTLAQLFVVTLLDGVAGNLGNITFYSIVPAVVPRAEFDHANARLEAANIGTMITGPGIAGAMIQAFGAARAVAASSVSFLVSVVLLLQVRDRTRRVRTEMTTTFLRDLVDGARFVFGDRRLRRLAVASAVGNLGAGIGNAVVLIYLYRNVGLSPGELGVIVTGTGLVGATIAFNAPRISRRAGYANALALSAACNGIGWLLLPAATHVPGLVALVVVVVAYLFMMVESGLWNVAMITLRRVFTPDEMFGRMVASTRTVAQGTQPLGALLGGVLGATLGVVPTIVVGGVLMAVCGSLALDPELRGIRAPDEMAV